jgi:hypothetical protein
MNEPYLWDRSGTPDPEISRLEDMLKPLRMPEKALDFRPLPRPSLLARCAAFLRQHWMVPVAAASVAAILFATWIAMAPPAVSLEDWEARAVSGAPELAGKRLKIQQLFPGQWLTTNRDSTVHLRAGNIGEIEIAGDSLVSLAETRRDRQRLSLRYGFIHARISAPPGFFIVDTPAARAIDLGCEYTLKIERDGRGELRVLTGWVDLSHVYKQSLVPAGASARIAADGTLSPPYFEDASAEFKQALLDFSFSDGGSPFHRAALENVLRDSRQRDALTLLNLFPRADAEERLLIFDRLNQLVPAPSSITRQNARAWEINSMNDWWPVIEKQLGLSAIKKGNRPLNDR